MNKPRDFTPPKFCKNAVASNAGWINPLDGTLVVPNRGLKTRMMEWEAKNKKLEDAGFKTGTVEEFLDPTPKEPEQTEAINTTNDTEESVVEEKKPKTKRKYKRKTKKTENKDVK